VSRGGLYVWPWLSRRRAVSLCTARPPDTLRRLHSQRVIITHLVRAVKLQQVSSYASTAVSSPSVAHDVTGKHRKRHARKTAPPGIGSERLRMVQAGALDAKTGQHRFSTQ
jgi:hypothetical protein